MKDKTYVDIKKPRVKSPVSDDIEFEDMDDSDIDEKTNVKVKGPKKKVKQLYVQNAPVDVKALHTSVSNTEFAVQSKVINLDKIQDKSFKDPSLSKRQMNKHPLQRAESIEVENIQTNILHKIKSKLQYDFGLKKFEKERSLSEDPIPENLQTFIKMKTGKYNQSQEASGYFSDDCKKVESKYH